MKNLTFTFTEAEIADILEGLEELITGLRDHLESLKDDPDKDMVWGRDLRNLKEAIELYERIGKQAGLEAWDYQRFRRILASIG